jgi:hypothetical protein
VNTGFLPPGFVAIDLAHALGLPLYDPDSQITDASGNKVYEPVDPTIPQQTATVRQRPTSGNGLIGGTGRILTPPDAKVIVAANGGSDLVYVPDHDARLVQRIVSVLSQQDYVGGLFVDDIYGDVPGALPLSSINLKGSTALPVPAVALSFKTFATDPSDRLITAVQIADTGLQEGQGMHGTLGRDNSFNNMAALGPDFKSAFVDQAPVSNADIAVTLAKILGFDSPSNGELAGRVLTEALAGAPASIRFLRKAVQSDKSATGRRTILFYQQVQDHRYFDEACYINVKGNPHNASCE